MQGRSIPTTDWLREWPKRGILVQSFLRYASANVQWVEGAKSKKEFAPILDGCCTGFVRLIIAGSTHTPGKWGRQHK